MKGLLFLSTLVLFLLSCNSTEATRDTPLFDTQSEEIAYYMETAAALIPPRIPHTLGEINFDVLPPHRKLLRQFNTTPLFSDEFESPFSEGDTLYKDSTTTVLIDSLRESFSLTAYTVTLYLHAQEVIEESLFVEHHFSGTSNLTMVATLTIPFSTPSDFTYDMEGRRLYLSGRDVITAHKTYDTKIEYHADIHINHDSIQIDSDSLHYTHISPDHISGNTSTYRNIRRETDSLEGTVLYNDADRSIFLKGTFTKKETAPHPWHQETHMHLPLYLAHEYEGEQEAMLEIIFAKNDKPLIRSVRLRTETGTLIREEHHDWTHLLD
ncbi:hypothetical protein [Chitinivibrio alkaliphilus]|uniref:Lipoprotein n=1 Tax=Chitinivibrio alkaliphilus ACht1 TaxID=1313304 RepID=U7D5X2_9BACT|nr:hypothetical protein [Chitinivibrio alkaliphilus]ERP30971.1 hypothetical protein CALK_2166 [Chitinivibrio alkaliphilus ACht1]